MVSSSNTLPVRLIRFQQTESGSPHLSVTEVPTDLPRVRSLPVLSTSLPPLPSISLGFSVELVSSVVSGEIWVSVSTP